MYQLLADLALLHELRGQDLGVHIVIGDKGEADTMYKAIKAVRPARRIFLDPTKYALEDGFFRLDNDVVHGEKVFDFAGGELEELFGLGDVFEALEQVVVGAGFHVATGEHVPQRSVKKNVGHQM